MEDYIKKWGTKGQILGSICAMVAIYLLFDQRIIPEGLATIIAFVLVVLSALFYTRDMSKRTSVIVIGGAVLVGIIAALVAYRVII